MPGDGLKSASSKAYSHTPKQISASNNGHVRVKTCTFLVSHDFLQVSRMSLSSPKQKSS